MRNIAQPCARTHTQRRVKHVAVKNYHSFPVRIKYFFRVDLRGTERHSYKSSSQLLFCYDRHSLRVIALLFSNHDWGDIRGPRCDAPAQTTPILPKTDLPASKTLQAPQKSPLVHYKLRTSYLLNLAKRR